MTVQDFKPAFLPASTPSLADEVPPAPAGSVFVLAANGGFTSPPRKFNIHFGRDREEAHVPVGVNDPHVSRQHGELSCQGREWWLRNDDRLPIRLPGEAVLLSGYAIPPDPGYTPAFIGASTQPQPDPGAFGDRDPRARGPATAGRGRRLSPSRRVRRRAGARAGAPRGR